MRILILVLSYNEGVFGDFMHTQKVTWDAEDYPSIDTAYYYGFGVQGMSLTAINSQQIDIKLNCSDAYDMMHWKFKLALQSINYHQYDFVLRTNSCSYIRKDQLKHVVNDLPREKCYAGWDNGGYVSGAGIWFTPDVIDILRNELTDQPHGAEDVLMGEILKGRVEISIL